MLDDELAGHVPADAEERADLQRMRSFVGRYRNPFDRRLGEGHLTGSALLIDHAGARIALLHHRKLDRWLQPGGHAEAHERDGGEVALREAHEETGLSGLSLHPHAPRPLDVDIHEIPARPGEPAHLHLDLRYLICAPENAELRLAESEAHQIRWFSWDELAQLELDPGLIRAVAKAREWVDP